MSAASSKNYKLLDYEIVLTDIVEEAIIELKIDIFKINKPILSKQFKFALKEYNNAFKLYFKDLHDKIKYQYRNFYDNYNKKMAYMSNITSTNKIMYLTDGFKKGFKSGFNLCLKELEKIFLVILFCLINFIKILLYLFLIIKTKIYKLIIKYCYMSKNN